MVICVERGADLHIAQLMPLPLTVSCFSKIQIGFAFLVPAHPGSPGQRAVKRVCVYKLNINETISRHTQNVNFYQLLIHHSHTNNKATKNAYNSRTYPINCYKAMLNNKTITDESALTFIVVYFFNSALIASLYSLLPLA